MNCCITCAAHPRRIFCDCVQHRLEIGWRAGNHPENFTRRRLLLQRFLEFIEQSHVLYGNDGLIGEGFKELDLRGGKGAYLDATRVQYSNKFTLLKEGSA